MTRRHKILSVEDLTRNPGVILTLKCRLHHQLYAFFDIPCQCLVCKDCLLSQHEGHARESLSVAAEKTRKCFVDMVVQCNTLAEHILSTKKDISRAQEKVKKQQTQAKMNVTKDIAKVILLLDKILLHFLMYTQAKKVH